MVCSSGVLLVPDTLLEATEAFFLLLESSDPSVILNPTLSELTVLIRDNNSKLIERVNEGLMSVYNFPM